MLLEFPTHSPLDEPIQGSNLCLGWPLSICKFSYYHTGVCKLKHANPRVIESLYRSGCVSNNMIAIRWLGWSHVARKAVQPVGMFGDEFSHLFFGSVLN